jgi:hypothetical protein
MSLFAELRRRNVRFQLKAETCRESFETAAFSKRVGTMRFITLTVVFVFLISLPASSDEAADEEAVWGLEEAYWVHVKNNDIDGYLTLWDERFVGWPGFSKKPMGKGNIAEWILPLHENSAETYDYELTREAVRSFGDVVVVHYLVRDFFRSASTGEIVRQLDTYRITHTWQRREGTWQIITGMSGVQAGK